MFKSLSCWNQQTSPLSGFFPFLKQDPDSEKCPRSRAQSEEMKQKSVSFFLFLFCKTELGACGHGTAQCLHDPLRVSATAAYCGMKTLHSGPRVSLCYPWSIAWGDWMGLCTLRLGSNFHPLTSWPLQPPPTASPIKTLRCVLTCTLSPLQQADGEEGAEPPRNNSFASRLDKKSEDLWPTASLQFLCIIFPSASLRAANLLLIMLTKAKNEKSQQKTLWCSGFSCESTQVSRLLSCHENPNHPPQKPMHSESSYVWETF